MHYLHTRRECDRLDRVQIGNVHDHQLYLQSLADSGCFRLESVSPVIQTYQHLQRLLRKLFVEIERLSLQQIVH